MSIAVVKTALKRPYTFVVLQARSNALDLQTRQRRPSVQLVRALGANGPRQEQNSPPALEPLSAGA
jgi:hypothetical protein